MSLPLKAYYVGHDEAAEIVFAVSNAPARRIGANALDSEWNDVECRRAPEFDAFSDKRFVPDEVKWEHGWWFYCAECDCRAQEGSGSFKKGRALCEDCDPVIVALKRWDHLEDRALRKTHWDWEYPLTTVESYFADCDLGEEFEAHP